MKKFLYISGIAILISASASAQSATAGASTPAGQRQLLDQYCVGCHNAKLKSGGMTLDKDKADTAHVAQNPELWEKVTRKLRAGMMPPAGARRPDAAAIKTFVGSLESTIDQAAVANPNPGRQPLHRLNRAEYANSIRDLLAVDVDVAGLLPADDSSQGFDNVADVLGTSPALIEGYMRAASKISRLAVGDTDVSPGEITWGITNEKSQLRHLEGAPFGTRGGVVVNYTFPVDGEYSFKLRYYYTNVGGFFGALAKDEKIEVAVDGERAFLLDIEPRKLAQTSSDMRTTRVKVKAGPHTVAFAFLLKSDGPVDDFLAPYERSMVDATVGTLPGYSAVPHLKNATIIGPYAITGVTDTPSRKRIFVCKPANEADEVSCAKKIISSLGRQAYRRPLVEQDIESLLSFYQEGRNKGSFEQGIQMVTQRIIASPDFVYRFERTPTGVAPGKVTRVSDVELASRLSYFLWSSAPDEQLLSLATQNKLHETATLERQVRRMLADSRSQALSTNFAGQWLYLRNLKYSEPDIYEYPNWDENLLESMRKETELFFSSIQREDRNIMDLLTADYTYMDERLAKHYGVANVYGNQFRRIPITDDNRKGLLGQAGILTVTSLSNRTSPVQRGKWVIENILGTQAPTPPPNVPALAEKGAAEGVGVVKSVRERMESHRSQEPCHSCHQIMDPIGFAMENFDAIGQWRNSDSGMKIDASGQLVDGSKVNGPASLRQALLLHSDAFVGNFTEKMLTYATGRRMEYFDMPTVRGIDRDAAKNNYRFSSFILGIVKSPPFLMRKAEETTQTRPAGGTPVAQKATAGAKGF